MDNNMSKLKVSRKIRKNEKKTIKSLIIFISKSEDVLNVLYKIPRENKENICMNIADITKQTSILLRKRSLQLLMISIIMGDFMNKLNQNLLSIIEIKKSKDIFFVKAINLIKLYYKKLGIKINIRKLERISRKYKNDRKICKQALDICSEFGRRLSFFLSV